MTLDQRRRVHSAVAQLAMVELSRILADTFQNVGGNSGSLQIRFERGRMDVPPLLTYLEERTVRDKVCTGCNARASVYGIAMFCPFCGSRDAAAGFVGSIDAARALLAVTAALPVSLRADLEARGGEDRLAENALGDVVSAFEAYCRARVTELQGAASLRAVQSRQGRNVFQRLDDAVSIIEATLRRPITPTLSASEWNELRVSFATRHVLTHNAGIADAGYVTVGGGTPIGQRVQVTRTAAERALLLLERVVQAM
jgi:hypothetical protein